MTWRPTKLGIPAVFALVQHRDASCRNQGIDLGLHLLGRRRGAGDEEPGV